MAIGRKTGGRVAGTPNKRTAELTERLEALNVDPVLGLAQIATDPAVSIELRARVQMELMAYLYPKRRALDTGPSDQQRVMINIGIPPKVEPAESVYS